ncbi:MAG: hypothetical protein MZV70_36405 [Desulfobacterales bacterium]|nr:hypothetical protein [Desulfobacterales bacterium]
MPFMNLRSGRSSAAWASPWKGWQDEVETPYGHSSHHPFQDEGHQKIVFISRHGEDHLPPHKVNYRAIISAARDIRRRRRHLHQHRGQHGRASPGQHLLP